jgi:hypothetical protein
MKKAWIVVPTVAAVLALPTAAYTAGSGSQHPAGKNAKALKTKAAAKRAKARSAGAGDHRDCPFRNQAVLL